MFTSKEINNKMIIICNPMALKREVSINRLIDMEVMKKLGSAIKLFNATKKCDERNNNNVKI